MAPLQPAAPNAARPPASWRRQQLVRLRAEGWAGVLAAPWDDEARDCLALWARRGLPLVVTRQPASQADVLATGLPAPASHRRRRLAVAVASRDVLLAGEFPEAAAATHQLPPALAPAWHALLEALAADGCTARVYGGHGWQVLTGLAYVHPASDLDLLLPVRSAAQADAVSRGLAHAQEQGWSGPRLDGELLFEQGAAVAWREWRAYREGRTAQVLVKRLHGVALEIFQPEAA